MRMIFGIFLILVGILFLLSVFSDIAGFSLFLRIVHNFQLFWPLILIVIGVYIIYLGVKKRWIYFLSVGVFVAFLLFLLVWPNEDVSYKEQMTFNGIGSISFEGGIMKVYILEGENFKVHTSEGIEVKKSGSKLLIKDSTWRKFASKLVKLELPPDIYEISFENGAFTVNGELNENRFSRILVRDCVLNMNFEFLKMDVPLYFKAEDCVLESSLEVPEGTSYFVEKGDGILSKTVRGKLLESSLDPKILFDFREGVFRVHLEGR
ncbi:DUF5668 domain-containing protein [Thermotoga sp. KOL6]|uniref:LiaI-LiaF-like domain-containing protein n=1 Tax=Thermotoga sp. KOL6 TaxID=126741 RepID=UPI000C76125B|nr:DUF5668 domain-containing protein [Thermotoga sp. KOL6]PLV59882.1 hypothetical protein AS005_00865 [Thermotoga sp. KOL6]